jgi:hypothetical protein
MTEPQIDFVLEDGVLLVKDDKEGFQPVPIPAGFTDLVFRNAVAATYTAYRRHGKVPTVRQVHAIWDRIPTTTYSALFMTPEFHDALAYRGIEWNASDGLSYEQSMAILKLSNPMDRRSDAVKLRELGIPVPRYQAWLKQPLFMAEMNAQTKAGYTEHLPAIRNALVGNAMGGDMKAIEMIFAITGEYDPTQRQVDDIRILAQKLIESVAARVSDPKEREAIAADMRLASASLSAINPAQAIGG